MISKDTYIQRVHECAPPLVPQGDSLLLEDLQCQEGIRGKGVELRRLKVRRLGYLKKLEVRGLEFLVSQRKAEIMSFLIS